MDIITYLTRELEKIAQDFPKITIILGKCDDLLVVELSDWDNPELDTRWIPVSLYCMENFPETLVFTGNEIKKYLKITEQLIKFN